MERSEYTDAEVIEVIHQTKVLNVKRWDTTDDKAIHENDRLQCSHREAFSFTEQIDRAGNRKLRLWEMRALAAQYQVGWV